MLLHYYLEKEYNSSHGNNLTSPAKERAQLREYSDFIEATRGYLKRYNQFQVTIANLNDDIEAMEHAIELEIAAPISKYGGQPGGGGSELTPTEQGASRISKAQDFIRKNKESIRNIERILRKVDRAIAQLKPDDQWLIRGHFIDHRSWGELSAEKFFTEKWARERSRKAIKKMAFMIFGNRALPEQQNLFIFYE